MAAAVHVARTSPPRLQTLHPAMVPPSSLSMPHPSSMPSGTMDPKQYFHSGFQDHHFPPLPFHPLHPPLPPPPPQPTIPYEEEMEEDIDEDDMSDLEEEFQQELLAIRNRRLEPDMTRQLLSFADRVSADINKVFGRKKGDEDSCDVYEDKWTVTKSGRELYYADLLRIAQGDFGDSKSPSTKTSEQKSAEVVEDNRHSFSGRADLTLGLGPLGELFEQGLQTGKQKKTPSQNSANKRQRTDSELTAAKSVPMSRRSLPESFWQEPGMSGQTTGSSSLDLPVATSSVVHSLSSGKLPDFSDLMDSWNGDQAQLQQQQQQLHTLQSMQQPLLHQHRPSVFDTTMISSDPTKKRRL